jgi:hypothetical protein
VRLGQALTERLQRDLSETKNVDATRVKDATNLLLSMSWWSAPGTATVTPVGLDMSNRRTTFLHKPILTSMLCILLLATEIGGCITLGKKLQRGVSEGVAEMSIPTWQM